MGSNGEGWKERFGPPAGAGTSTGCEAGDSRGSDGGEGALRRLDLSNLALSWRESCWWRDCSTPMLDLGDTSAASCALDRGVVAVEAEVEDAVAERLRGCCNGLAVDVGMARAWEGECAGVGCATAEVNDGGAAWALAADDDDEDDRACRPSRGRPSCPLARPPGAPSRFSP